jgi:hypothetical protein
VNLDRLDGALKAFLDGAATGGAPWKSHREVLPAYGPVKPGLSAPGRPCQVWAAWVLRGHDGGG